MDEQLNYPAGGNAEFPLWFAIERHSLGVPQPGCWTK
jgi:hypothetical protein